MLYPMRRPVFICACTHRKSDHGIIRFDPKGPCTLCACMAFLPEKLCRCGHGEKAHRGGPCHETYLDNCRAFRAADDPKEGGE